MSKQKIRELQLLILCLMMSMITVSAQAPTNYTITLWTFDKSRQYNDDKEIQADIERLPDSSSLNMSGGVIDSGGASGNSYIDNCGIKYEKTESIRWDDVRGENDDIVEDDAQLEVTVNTTDWENIAFRFAYLSVNTKTFDLSYHLGDGQWKLVANDVVIDPVDDWRNIEVGLQDVADLENREIVVFLLHDLSRDSGRGEFRMDNIAVLGNKISAPDDCPPLLEATAPIEDIGIILNSGNIPTFTGDDGIQFKLSDDKTPFSELTILALSSDPNIINQLGLSVVDADNGVIQLEIGAPYGIAGVADVTIRVTDSSGNSVEQVIKYGVADPIITDTTAYHQGTSQASASVALNDSMIVIANDSNQLISIYSRNQSGYPITTIDVSENLELADRRNDDTYPEVDIEAGTQIGNRQFWLGSHSNSEKGDRLSNHFRLFATETSGEGDNTQLSFIGYYDDLLDDLHKWGKEQGYAFKSAIQDNIRPSKEDGLNIEGFAIAPDGQTAYIGFRTPLTKKSKINYALIAPLQNFSAWFNNGTPSDDALFGDPIELDLGGLGIRGMECNTNGCLIIAGSIDSEGLFAIYSWSGNPADAPTLRSANLTGLEPESLLLSPNTNFDIGETIQLISDSGDTDWYHLGRNAGDLPANLQFFRSDWIVIE